MQEVKINLNTLFMFFGVVIVIAFVWFLFTQGGNGNNTNPSTASNVALENDKQIITFKAKAGYTPTNVVAKAGMPTVLRFNANSTYDCSSQVLIKKYNILKDLNPNGTTEIEIPAQDAGNDLNITCSMGMYSAKIKFT